MTAAEIDGWVVDLKTTLYRVRAVRRAEPDRVLVRGAKGWNKRPRPVAHFTAVHPTRREAAKERREWLGFNKLLLDVEAKASSLLRQGAAVTPARALADAAIDCIIAASQPDAPPTLAAEHLLVLALEGSAVEGCPGALSLLPTLPRPPSNTRPAYAALCNGMLDRIGAAAARR